jgi:hypothetical protein
MANWDPSYPKEKVNWYDEYISRHAPISTSWLQQPWNRESAEHEYLEIRGMGLYTASGDSDSSLVVGPLDDGSVCIWDIAGARSRKGSIIARSNSRILFPPGVTPTDPKGQLNTISTGVTECVSIDNVRKRAYVAVHNGMISTSSNLKLPVYPIEICSSRSLATRRAASCGRHSLKEVTLRSYALHPYVSFCHPTDLGDIILTMIRSCGSRFRDTFYSQSREISFHDHCSIRD